MAPAGKTSQSPAFSASAMTSNTIAAWSATGSVFGMAQTAVKPPTAAALAPVSTISLSSRPGSRRCAWRSTNPGASTWPSQSNTSAPSAPTSPPTEAISESSTRTSVIPSCPEAGSTSRPSRNKTFATSAPLGLPAAENRVEQRHAHGDAVRDLIGDERLWKVGHIGGDLHSAVHRPRMHDQRLLGKGVDAVLVEP